MKKLLAMDFGGTFIKYGLIDADGNLSDHGEIPAPLQSIDLFIEVVRNVWRETAAGAEGIAVSLPGIIDNRTGYLYTAGAYSPILAGRNLFELLSPISERISVENDGNCAVLAETWKGALSGVRSGAAVIIGSSVGGGIILDGKLVRGAHCISAELGCLMAQPGIYEKGHTIAYKAGTTALLKAVADAKGIPRSGFEIAGINRYGTDAAKEPLYSGKDVFRWIEEGDVVTTEVYLKWLDALVFAIYNLKMIVDPEKIVIGGGVSCSTRLLPDLKERYEKTRGLTSAAGMMDLDIELCKFSSEANLVGAACNWIRQYETA